MAPDRSDPLHTAPVCGVSVRFYAAPTGRTEAPWHSATDIHAALRLPHSIRAELVQKAKLVLPSEVATAPDGTTIQSHRVLIGLVAALADDDAVPPTFEVDYAAAGEGVLAAMHAGLTEDEQTDALVAMTESLIGVKLVVQPRQSSAVVR